MAVACAIRRYITNDRDAIREINRQAFRMPEPGTFEKLLGSAAGAMAWVAVSEKEQVLGHVICTPATIAVQGRTVSGMGLGELAVLPEFQRQGIGSRLGSTAIGALRTAGCPFVIVVGHAAYYPRFGFRPGAQLGLRCQWEKVPAAAFMALVLDPVAMHGVTGLARFRDVD